jgi:hypothetical protein
LQADARLARFRQYRSEDSLLREKQTDADQFLVLVRRWPTLLHRARI